MITDGHHLRRPTGRRLAGLMVVLALLATGCGSSGPEAAADEPPASGPQPEATGGDPVEDPGTDPGVPQDQPTGRLEVLVPDTVAAPDTMVALDADCASEATLGPGWFAYAVPGTWEQTGRSSGGAGSPLSDSTDARFDTPEGPVEISIDPDQRDLNGAVIDANGEVTDNFDREVVIDGTTTVGTFEPAGSTTVGDQEVEVMVLDQAQAADAFELTEHKVRVEVVSMPAMADPSSVATSSVVLTISHDAEEGSPAAGEVTAIIGSFAMPGCTAERVLVEGELMLQVDLDGDGHVSDVEDMMALTLDD